MSRTQLEKKYGIKIANDSYYNPIKDKVIKLYKIYSADGCCWEKGLRSIKAVQAECEEWATQLLNIKNRVYGGC